ncbi:PAS domain S-box protein [Peribacillus cavernae]|nr:PAS domain S-box protein [Peribacillus cavernae]MDQ0218739.1 PAS domain S-box-containing protein [Peribacillus cavernae]
MLSMDIEDKKDLLFFDYIPAVTAVIKKNGEIIYFNKRAAEFFDAENNDFQGFPFVNEKDEEYLLSWIRTEQSTERNSREIQVRVSGENRWVTFKHSSIKFKQYGDCHILTFFDVTSYKETYSLLNIKKKTIKMILKGGSLSFVLNKLSLLVEELLHKQLHTGVMFLDEAKEHLHVAASPTLPRSFINRINGVKYTPTLGSCGPAIFTNKMAICTDIATDRNWESSRDMALEHGIHSSWSFPIIIDNESIGTFSMYHSKPYSPTKFEREVLETCSYIIGLAVERDRRKKVAESYAEQTLGTLSNSIKDIVIFKDQTGNWVETNHALKKNIRAEGYCFSGKSEEELIATFPENKPFFLGIKNLTDDTLHSKQTCRKEISIKSQGRNFIYDFKTAPLPHKKGVLLIGRDVTEKTKIKEELETTKMELENTLKLQKAITCKFEKSGDTFKVTMAKGDGLYNFGLDETKMVNRTLEEIFPANKIVQIKEYLDKVWAGEEILGEDDLNGVYFIASIKPSYKNNMVTEIILSAMDITGFKAIENKLKESRRRYQSLVKNSPDAIYYQNLDGEILEANKASGKITGYKVRELQNMPFQNYVKKEYHESTIYHLRKAIDGIPQRYETSLITKSGESCYLSVTKIPVIENGNVSGVFGIAKDITNEKKIVEELKNTKEQLESFIENTSDAIIIMDLRGTILKVNYAFERTFGWSKTEAKGQNIEIIQQERKYKFNKYVKSMFEGKRMSDCETVCCHKLGHSLEISLTLGAIRDKKGNVIALSSIMRDITDRKKTEDLLRKAEQLAMIGQLAAGVAHEIRNPLTSLNGFLQLINEMLGKNEYIAVMRDELKRIEFITNEFLSLAKPQVKLFQKKDISLIIDGVVKIAGIQAVIKNIVITPEYASVLPLIECDENQLKQVFLNILKNAIESMGSGGQIHIYTKVSKGFVQINVIDYGCGIPEERLKHLGEPFYSTKEKGTGLGLMISKKIITEHKGQLLINSTEGIGTTITVLLPYIQ